MFNQQVCGDMKKVEEVILLTREDEKKKVMFILKNLHIKI